MTVREPIPFWRWSLWFTLLALALVVFYGILTPIWMAIRVVAWLSEHVVLGRRARAHTRRS